MININNIVYYIYIYIERERAYVSKLDDVDLVNGN